VDDIIIVRPLSHEDIAQIVDIQIKRVEKLLADRKLTLRGHTRGEAAARRGGLRSCLWGAALEACDPAALAGIARRCGARGAIRRGGPILVDRRKTAIR